MEVQAEKLRTAIDHHLDCPLTGSSCVCFDYGLSSWFVLRHFGSGWT